MIANDLDQYLLLPDDSHDRTLVGNVHPPDWVNPTSDGRYNIVVIGAGTAGLVTAAIAAGVGAKVALVERQLMGGDCLNVGCVPSKAIIRAARAWSDLRRMEDFGVHIPPGVKYDFGTAMTRMRRLRASLSRMDSAHRFKKLGVDVFLGNGCFAGSNTIEVHGSAGSRTVRFSKAAICTGARAAAPPISGLEKAGYLTNETIFNLTELPRRLAVIGAGPIGCEMAQSFARFGSKVVLFERLANILPREDVDAAEAVQCQMKKDGVEFVFHANVTKVDTNGMEKIISYETEGAVKELVVDQIVVGTGRSPNVEGLGLDRAGVDFDTREGVKVSQRLQTSNARIFAAGDVCFPFKFTHTADAMAQILIQNALFPHPLGLGYASTTSLIIPWCTYTVPEIAHVGMYEADAKIQGIEIETYTFNMNEVDRAVLDGEEEGFARIHVKKGSDRILGVTIVAAHAGDMINEFTVLMRGGLGAKLIAGTIHPYPTQAEVNRKVVNLWRKAHFTEGQKTILRKWFAWCRKE